MGVPLIGHRGCVSKVIVKPCREIHDDARLLYGSFVANSLTGPRYQRMGRIKGLMAADTMGDHLWRSINPTRQDVPQRVAAA